MNNEILSYTTAIAAAYLGHQVVAANEVPSLLSSIHGALHRLSVDGEKPARPEPSVPIGKAVTPDKVHCLDCDFSGSMLKRHIRDSHDLTPEAYRQRWGLAANSPMTAPNYAKRRSKIAKQFGLGKNVKRK